MWTWGGGGGRADYIWVYGSEKPLEYCGLTGDVSGAAGVRDFSKVSVCWEENLEISRKSLE